MSSLGIKPLSEQKKRTNLSIEEVIELIRQSDNILIVSHHRPDGDCLGSTVGLYYTLLALGKRVAAYNATPLTDKWAFVPGIENVKNSFPDWEVSLTIFVDCGAVYRVHDDFKPVGTTLNIDHHKTNDCFGDFNYIDLDACAVGEQIFDLHSLLGLKLTKEIAWSLYLSILTDTGCFRYSNTTARCLKIAGELVQAGAEPGPISQAIYESRSREELSLSSLVYQRLQYEQQGTMVWSELFWKDYEANGGIENEPEGIVSEIRGVQGVEISALLHETEEGWLRAGFRGKGSIDCSWIATTLGGGGHFNASGVTIKHAPYKESKERVLATVRAKVEEYLKSKA